MQRVHFQVRVGVTNIYLVNFLYIVVKKETNRMWFSVVCPLIDNDTSHHSGPNSLDLRVAATSQRARFALVTEYVSSIHPWANNRC